MGISNYHYKIILFLCIHIIVFAFFKPAVHGMFNYMLSIRHLAYGAPNKQHCNSTFKGTPFSLQPHLLLDLTDMAVMDFLSFHFDSKIYVTDYPKGNTTIYLDRGRA